MGILMLKLFFIPIFLFILCGTVGFAINKVARLEVKSCYIIGLVFFFGMTFVISTPFMLFNLRFSTLYALIIGIYGIVLTASIGVLFYNIGNVCDICREKCQEIIGDRRRCCLYIILFITILFQLFVIVYYQHGDIDDSYYLAQVNTYISTDRLTGIDPASGLTYLKSSSQYSLVGYEVLLAVLKQFFRTNTAMLAHTIWPVFALVSHYIVIWKLAKCIDDRYAIELSITYSLITIFGGWSGYTQSSFVLNRIWQGKAVFVALFIPILLWYFAENYNNKARKRDIVFIALILLAGISTTTVAIYLYPIMYFCLWCGKFIDTRNIKETLKLCCPIIIILPWIAAKLMFMYKDKLNGLSTYDIVTDGADNLSYIAQLMDRFLSGHSSMLLLFIAALIIITFEGCRRDRGLIVYPVICLGITFANPLLIGFVAKYITGADVYWRIFWLLDMPIVFTMAIYIIIKTINDKNHVALAFILMDLAVIALGQSIFENGSWAKRENVYKLDQRTVDIVDVIHADANGNENTLLLPEELSYGVRELCGDIKVPVNRYSKSTFISNGEEQKYNILENNLIIPLYTDQNWNIGTLDDSLRKFDIDYLVLYTASLTANDISDNMECIYQNDEYTIMKYKKS